MDLGLADKVAIVTGATGGLGRAVAELFCAEGADVILGFHRREAEAREISARLSGTYGRTVRAVPVDLANAAEIDSFFEEGVRSLNGFDVLVNNAGTWPTRAAAEIPDGEWDETIRVNLTGAFLLSKRAVAHFVASGRKGRIINIVSITSVQGSATGHAHYAAAKGGLLAFTYSLAHEAARHGITVNAVCPGMMRTEMNEAVLASDESAYLARIPLGRISTPEEVAPAVLFLASGMAGYITGSTLNVSGGMLMR